MRSDKGVVGGSPSPASLLDNTVTSSNDYAYTSSLKLVSSGKLLEVYEFQKPIFVNHRNKKQKLWLKIEEMQDILCFPENYGKNSKRAKEYKRRNATKAKNRIRRLVQENFDKAGKFLTLTFRNTAVFDITSLSECHQRFAYFIKKIRVSYPDIGYVAVPEFQKRGAVHYHLILDLPFVPIKELRRFWPYGFIKINKIDNPALVGVYVSKYLSKAYEDPRYEGHRRYYSSKNLSQPTTNYNEKRIRGIIEALERKGFVPSYTSSYKSEWSGTINYSSYNLYQLPAQNEEHGST